MERPFNQIRDTFRESNAQNKDLLKYVFEKSDSITLWVIGIAIGGISIIANNIAGVKGALSPEYLRMILVLLSVSVTAGIAYRGLFLYYFVRLNRTHRGIDIALSRSEMMDTETYLTGGETFSELLYMVKTGFGDDLEYLRPSFDQADDIGRGKLYDSVVNHYLNSVQFAKRDTEMAFDFIAETYSKFSGVSKARYMKAVRGESGFLTDRKVMVITSVFYFLYILSFIVALFMFALGC